MLSLPAIQSKMMKTEIAISTVINAVIIPVLLWLAPIPPPLELWGANGVAASLVKGTIIPVLLMSTLITFLLRKRVTKMNLAPLDRSATPFAWLGGLPSLPPLRAVIFVLAALVTVMPVSLAVAGALKTYPMTEPSFFLFNVVYGVVIALMVTPFVVLAVLHEPRKTPVNLVSAQ